MIETLHTEKTEAFYQEVLKIHLDMSAHSNLANGKKEPEDQLILEAKWAADEVAYGLEIRLSDTALAGIEADVKAGCSMACIGDSEETQEAIDEAWQDVTQLNNVVVIEHDSLSITESILEKVASGKALDAGDRQFAGFIARYLESRYKVEGCWLETPAQRHQRFLVEKGARQSRQRTPAASNQKPTYDEPRKPAANPLH
jgi:hypothetical protein